MTYILAKFEDVIQDPIVDAKLEQLSDLVYMTKESVKCFTIHHAYYKKGNESRESRKACLLSTIDDMYRRYKNLVLFRMRKPPVDSRGDEDPYKYEYLVNLLNGKDLPVATKGGVAYSHDLPDDEVFKLANGININNINKEIYDTYGLYATYTRVNAKKKRDVGDI
jgi:hypothetical protein